MKAGEWRCGACEEVQPAKTPAFYIPSPTGRKYSFKLDQEAVYQWRVCKECYTILTE